LVQEIQIAPDSRFRNLNSLSQVSQSHETPTTDKIQDFLPPFFDQH
jgi:hypothetical protein